MKKGNDIENVYYPRIYLCEKTGGYRKTGG